MLSHSSKPPTPTLATEQLLLDLSYCTTRSPCKDSQLNTSVVNSCDSAHSMTSGSPADQSPASSVCASSIGAPTMLMFGEYTPVPQIGKERKRRRMIGNMDNTLDGLVAKRAELDPQQKRYQTENEAIELPDDEIEMKRMETDPDVSTRMCSVCGYQGKWVSEMIRHKRVHTNDRPFKCKYCNRTSKWKADLIRHVAKTHGIRVVSKYSRSKAFDGGSSSSDELKGSSSPIITENKNSSSVIQMVKQYSKIKKEIKKDGKLATFRCLICFFEQDSMDIIGEHLHHVHNVSPFECLKCNSVFEKLNEATEHCTEQDNNVNNDSCTSLDIRVNFGPIYGSSSVSSTKISNENFSSAASFSSASSSSICDENRNEEDIEINDKIKTERKIENCCQDCPFKCLSVEKFKLHQAGHYAPNSTLNYKCLFCTWSAKKKTLVERHMLIHTSHPERLMAQVEQNYTKQHLSKTMPLSLQLSSPQSSAIPTLKNLNNKSVPNNMQFLSSAAQIGKPFLGNGLENPLLTTSQKPISGFMPPLASNPQQMNAILQMLYTINPMLSATFLANSQLPRVLPNLNGPFNPLNANFPLMQQLSSNPLLAFGLCSLLDMKNKNGTEIANDNNKIDQMI